jgi:hypothetical protein
VTDNDWPPYMIMTIYWTSVDTITEVMAVVTWCENSGCTACNDDPGDDNDGRIWLQGSW